MKPFLLIDHVTLLVRDLDKSIEFYSGKLGFEVYGETISRGRKIVFLKSGDVRLDLFGALNGEVSQEHPRQGIGVVHVALKVADFDETYDELVKRGVEFHIKPYYQPKDHPKAGKKVAFFKDPDGNIFHLTYGN